MHQLPQPLFIMITDHLAQEFRKAFTFSGNANTRGIGIECEMPIVTRTGEAPPQSTIQEMFIYLKEQGFQLEWDSFSNRYIAASRKNETQTSDYSHSQDTITTDVGYSIIELVLSPENNLHSIQQKFDTLISILLSFFEEKGCQILGYGIHPLSPPSKSLIMPKERYSFFEQFSSNKMIPSSEGNDAAFLTITASNQCHIEVSSEEAIPVTNTLNALSGLQIAFQANSPIWNGNIQQDYKANREILWDYTFPDRMNQIGIPPQFDSFENYLEYIFDFRPLLVKREDQFLRILNKETFHDFLQNTSPTLGSTLTGEKRLIEPEQEDINQLLPFTWFNARLSAKYGTIESRMCCQQPPKETLTSAALTLGLVENITAAQQLASTYPIQTWRTIRSEAAKHVFNAEIDGKSILPLLEELYTIAYEGLQKRGLGEEHFLAPLHQRLQQRKSPACVALEIYEKEGFKSFLDHFSFKSTDLVSAESQVSTLTY